VWYNRPFGAAVAGDFVSMRSATQLQLQ